jgi:hypothetical protein
LLGALEYDLRAILAVDIRGLFTSPPTISLRQVIVWIRYLPSDSALGRRGAAGDMKHTLHDRLLAAIVNTGLIHDYHYVGAHSDKGKGPDVPDLIRFPDDEKRGE